MIKLSIIKINDYILINIMKFFQNLFNSQQPQQKKRKMVKLEVIASKKQPTISQLRGLFNFASFRQNLIAMNQKQANKNILAISNLYTNRNSAVTSIKKNQFQSQKYTFSKDSQLYMINDNRVNFSQEKKQFKNTIILTNNQKKLQRNKCSQQSKCIGKIKFVSSQNDSQKAIIFQNASKEIQPYIILQKIKYALSINDTIKFGRKKYQIVAMYDGLQFISNKSQFSDIFSLYNLKNQSKIPQNDKQLMVGDHLDINNKKTCKFCLLTSQELKAHEQVYMNGIDGSLLISPCKCKGSCSVVHISCLKTWLNTKLKRTNRQNFQSYNFSNLICQICKEDIPRTICVQDYQQSQGYERRKFQKQKSGQIPKTQRRRGQISYRNNKKDMSYVSLVDVDIFQANNSNKRVPFLVLKGTEFEDDKQKQLIKIKFSTKQKLVIGRNSDSDIILNDVSISRNHSVISFKQQTRGFYLKDNDSKYGTLIKVRQNINLLDYKYGLKLQIENDIIKCQIEEEGKSVDDSQKNRRSSSKVKKQKEKENKQNIKNIFSLF